MSVERTFSGFKQRLERKLFRTATFSCHQTLLRGTESSSSWFFTFMLSNKIQKMNSILNSTLEPSLRGCKNCEKWVDVSTHPPCFNAQLLCRKMCFGDKLVIYYISSEFRTTGACHGIRDAIPVLRDSIWAGYAWNLKHLSCAWKGFALPDITDYELPNSPTFHDQSPPDSNLSWLKQLLERDDDYFVLAIMLPINTVAGADRR